MSFKVSRLFQIKLPGHFLWKLIIAVPYLFDLQTNTVKYALKSKIYLFDLDFSRIYVNKIGNSFKCAYIISV